VDVNDDVDYISVLLGMGRIVDLQAEQINKDEITSIVTAFKDKVSGMKVNSGSVQDIGAAFLTSSCVSHSNEVETTNSVVKLWDNLREQVPINDQKDLAATILGTGRIMDIRVDVKDPKVLKDIVSNIRKEMEDHVVESVTFKEMSILLLAAAFVELSPKVEKYRDIVRSWTELRDTLHPNDDVDIVSVILFSGKIKDLDTSMMIQASSVTDQVGFIRTALEKVWSD